MMGFSVPPNAPARNAAVTVAAVFAECAPEEMIVLMALAFVPRHAPARYVVVMAVVVAVESVSPGRSAAGTRSPV